MAVQQQQQVPLAGGDGPRPSLSTIFLSRLSAQGFPHKLESYASAKLSCDHSWLALQSLERDEVTVFSLRDGGRFPQAFPPTRAVSFEWLQDAERQVLVTVDVQGTLTLHTLSAAAASRGDDGDDDEEEEEEEDEEEAADGRRHRKRTKKKKKKTRKTKHKQAQTRTYDRLVDGGRIALSEQHRVRVPLDALTEEAAAHVDMADLLGSAATTHLVGGAAAVSVAPVEGDPAAVDVLLHRPLCALRFSAADGALSCAAAVALQTPPPVSKKENKKEKKSELVEDVAVVDVVFVRDHCLGLTPDGTLLIWESTTGRFVQSESLSRLRRQRRKRTEGFVSMSVCPDVSRVAALTLDGSLFVLDLALRDVDTTTTAAVTTTSTTSNNNDGDSSSDTSDDDDEEEDADGGLAGDLLFRTECERQRDARYKFQWSHLTSSIAQRIKEKQSFVNMKRKVAATKPRTGKVSFERRVVPADSNPLLFGMADADVQDDANDDANDNLPPNHPQHHHQQQQHQQQMDDDDDDDEEDEEVGTGANSTQSPFLVSNLFVFDSSVMPPVRRVWFAHFSMFFTIRTGSLLYVPQRSKLELHRSPTDANDNSNNNNDGDGDEDEERERRHREQHEFRTGDGRVVSCPFQIREHLFPDEQPFLPLLSDGRRHSGHAPHCLLREGVCVLVPQQSATEVLRNLLVFSERSAAASSSPSSPATMHDIGPLCAANGWDLHAARTAALEMGLTFREPSLIARALHELQSNDPVFPSTEEQELIGCAMLMRHISDNADRHASSTVLSSESESDDVLRYFHALLQLGVDYISGLIKKHTQELLQHQGRLGAEHKQRQLHQRRISPSSLVTVVLKLSANLDQVRHLQAHIQSIFDKRSKAVEPFRTRSSESSSAASPLSQLEGRALGSLRMRPRKIDDREIEQLVRRVLERGRVSDVVRALQPHVLWLDEQEKAKKRKLLKKRGKFVVSLSTQSPLLFVRTIAGQVVYQLLCNEQMNFLSVCTRLLRVYGESETAFLLHIAFATCRRSLRDKLLRHLAHTTDSEGRPALGERDLELIRFVHLLEAFYPNPCYTASLNRGWQKRLLMPLARIKATASERHGRLLDGDSSDGDGDDDDMKTFRASSSSSPARGKNQRQRRRRRWSKKAEHKGTNKDDSAAAVYTREVHRLTEKRDLHGRRVIEGRDLGTRMAPWQRYHMFRDDTEPGRARDDDGGAGSSSGGGGGGDRSPSTPVHLASPGAGVDDGGLSPLLPMALQRASSGDGQRSSPMSPQSPASAESASDSDTDSSDADLDIYQDSSGADDDDGGGAGSPFKTKRKHPRGGQYEQQQEQLRREQRQWRRRQRAQRSRRRRQPLSQVIDEEDAELWQCGDVDDLELDSRKLLTLRPNSDVKAGMSRVPEQSADLQPVQVDLLLSADGGEEGDESVHVPDLCLECNKVPEETDHPVYLHREGYSFTPLLWLRTWDAQKRYRVLLDKGADLHDLGLARDDPVGVARAKLAYFVSHNQTVNVTHWVDSLDVRGAAVSPLGYLEAEGKDPVLKEVCSIAEAVLDQCTTFMREHLLDQLTTRGVFVASALRLPLTPTNAFQERPPVPGVQGLFDFTLLMLRLAKNNLLFLPAPHHDDDRDKRVSLDALVPHGRLSEFHLFVIGYCIQQDLPRVLIAYVSHYSLPLRQLGTFAGLDKGMASLFASTTKAWSQLPPAHSDLSPVAEAKRSVVYAYTAFDQGPFVPRDVPKPLSPWYDVYLFVQHGNLYKASLLNAAITVKGPRERVSTSIQNLFSKGRHIMALATLMYAPASMLSAAPHERAFMQQSARSMQKPRGGLRVPVLEPAIVHLRVAAHHMEAFKELKMACFPPVPEFPALKEKDDEGGAAGGGPADESKRDARDADEIHEQLVASAGVRLGRDELLQGNIHSWQTDVSLYDLLETTTFTLDADSRLARRLGRASVRLNALTALNNPLYVHNHRTGLTDDELEQVLAWARDNERFSNVDPTTVPFMYFAHPAMMHRGHREFVDYTYLLQKSHPVEAFLALREQERAVHLNEPSKRHWCRQIVFAGEIRNGDVEVSNPVEPAFVYENVVVVALKNLLEPSVEASCVFLLGVCGQDTTRFRLIVEAAKRVYNHRLLIGRGAGPATADDDDKQTLEDVQRLMLPLARYPAKGTEARVCEACAAVEEASGFLMREMERIVSGETGEFIDTAIDAKLGLDRDDAFYTEFDMDMRMARQLTRARLGGDAPATLRCDWQTVQLRASDVGVAIPTPFIERHESNDPAVERVSGHTQPWHLLLKFQVHFDTPIAHHYLVPIVTPKRWPRLLLEGSDMKIPTREVLKLVNAHCPESPWRYVYLVYLRLLLTQQQQQEQRQPRDSKKKNIMMMNQHMTSSDLATTEDVDLLLLSPGTPQHLLDLAWGSRKPLLAVLASSMPGAAYADCFLTFLHLQLLAHLEMQVKGGSVKVRRHAELLIDRLATVRDSARRGSSYVLAVELYMREIGARADLVTVLEHSLSLFYPDAGGDGVNPLLVFVRSCLSFHHSQDIDGLITFTRMLRTESKDLQRKDDDDVDDGDEGKQRMPGARHRPVNPRPRRHMGDDDDDDEEEGELGLGRLDSLDDAPHPSSPSPSTQQQQQQRGAQETASARSWGAAYEQVRRTEGLLGLAAAQLERLLLHSMPIKVAPAAVAPLDASDSDSTTADEEDVEDVEEEEEEEEEVEEEEEEDDDVSSSSHPHHHHHHSKRKKRKKKTHTVGSRLRATVHLLQTIHEADFCALYTHLVALRGDVQLQQRADKRTQRTRRDERERFMSSWISFINTCQLAVHRVRQAVAAEVRGLELPALCEFPLPAELETLAASLDEQNDRLTTNVSLHPLMEELRATLVDLREGFLWEFEDERVAFWRECHERMRRENINLFLRRSFFSSVVEELGAELTDQEREIILAFILSYEEHISRPAAKPKKLATVSALAVEDAGSGVEDKKEEEDGGGEDFPQTPQKQQKTTTSAAGDGEKEVVSPSALQQSPPPFSKSKIQWNWGAWEKEAHIDGQGDQGPDRKTPHSTSTEEEKEKKAEEEDDDDRERVRVPSRTDLINYHESTLRERLVRSTSGRYRAASALSAITTPRLEDSESDDGLLEHLDTMVDAVVEIDNYDKFMRQFLVLPVSTADVHVADELIGLVLEQRPGVGVHYARDLFSRYQLHTLGYESGDLALIELASLASSWPLNVPLSQALARVPSADAALQAIAAKHPELVEFSQPKRSRKLKRGKELLRLRLRADDMERAAVLGVIADSAYSRGGARECALMQLRYEVAEFLHWSLNRAQSTKPHEIVAAVLDEERRTQRALFHRRAREEEEEAAAVEAKRKRDERDARLGMRRRTRREQTQQKAAVVEVKEEEELLETSFGFYTPPLLDTSLSALQSSLLVKKKKAARSRQQLLVHSSGSFDHVPMFSLVQRLFKLYDREAGEAMARAVAEIHFRCYCEADSAQTVRVPLEADLLFLSALVPAHRLRTVGHTLLAIAEQNMGDGEVLPVPTTVPLRTLPLLREANAAVLAYRVFAFAGDAAGADLSLAFLQSRVPFYVDLTVRDRDNAFASTKTVSPGFEVLRRLFMGVAASASSCALTVFQASVGEATALVGDVLRSVDSRTHAIVDAYLDEFLRAWTPADGSQAYLKACRTLKKHHLIGGYFFAKVKQRLGNAEFVSPQLRASLLGGGSATGAGRNERVGLAEEVEFHQITQHLLAEAAKNFDQAGKREMGEQMRKMSRLLAQYLNSHTMLGVASGSSATAVVGAGKKKKKTTTTAKKTTGAATTTTSTPAKNKK